MKTHRVKTVQPYFGLVRDGRMTFSVRLNDRDYQQGDILLQEECDAKTARCLGEFEVHLIGTIMKHSDFDGVGPGYSVLSLIDASLIDGFEKIEYEANRVYGSDLRFSTAVGRWVGNRCELASYRAELIGDQVEGVDGVIVASHAFNRAYARGLMVEKELMEWAIKAATEGDLEDMIKIDKRYTVVAGTRGFGETEEATP